MIKSPATKVQPSPERLAVQMKYMERRYDDVLGKVLEQNALILNSVSRMQDDLKTLRTKLETLELSVQQEETPKVNGNDSKLNESLSAQTAQAATAALVGQTLASMPTGPFQPPTPFFNPYASALYNPYMMLPDPMSYLVNPYAAMYGALSQNPAATAAVELPKPTIPPFSFGVQLPASTPESSITSNVNAAANISFGASKSSAVDLTKKVENGIPGPNPMPAKPFSSAETVGKVEASTISFTPPKQLTSTTTAATKVPAQTTPPKSVISTPPAKPGILATPTIAATAVSSTMPASTNVFPAATSTFSFSVKSSASTTTAASIFSTPPVSTAASSKPFTFGVTSTGASQVDGPILSSMLNPPKSVPAVTKDAKESEATKKIDPAVDFAALSSNMCGFKDIKPTDKNPFGEFKGFGNTGSVQVFGASNTQNPARPKSAVNSPASTTNLNASGHEDGHEEDDFVPTAEFTPVIPLPPLVEVKKGDENETVLFQHRAKLLRFVKETKEWKERGVGDIKILQAKDNLQKIRVVMWREKVHKIACNHWVTKEIKVTNYQGSPKNLMWTAIDFAEAEEGPKTEIFVCRFGQEEQAEKFKKQMEHVVSLVGDTPTTPEKASADNTSTKSESKTDVTKSTVPLSQAFKKPEGQWTCETCYVDNKKESTTCLACTTPRPGAVPFAKPVEQTPPKFTFGFGSQSTATATTPSNIAPAPSPASGNKDAIFSLKSSSVTSNITFGFPSPATKPPTDQDTKKAEGPSTTSTPATTANTATTAPFLDFSKISSNMPTFGSLGSTGTAVNANPFMSGKGWNAGTAQPVFGSALKSQEPSSPSGNKEDEVDDFVPTAEFAPVIPLPPLVEVKKGDEDENVLFQHRAKLLRFVKETKEWKERGVGDIKILQAKDSEAKIRVVMWREKVHKIACNHWVTKDMDVTKFQGMAKNLMWTAVDFAEADEGPKTEIFVCKFGNEDRAQEFKTQMEKAIQIVKNAPATPEKTSQKDQIKDTSAVKPLSELFKKPEGEWSCGACYCSNSKDRSTCISCSTPRPSSAPQTNATIEGKSATDLIAKAESLQLPSNYFTQLCDKSSHPPCRGCDPDAFDFSVLDGRKLPVFEDIPKPQRQEGNETLKDLLTKTTESNNKGTPGGLLSNFNFTLPSSTSISSTTSSSNAVTAASDLKTQSSVPTFTFTPNFTFSPNKNPVEPIVPTTISVLNDNANDEDDEEGEDDDEDDDDDTMFVNEGRAYFRKSDTSEYIDHGEGHVKIVYDGDHYCGRFVFVPAADEDDLYLDHIIHNETELKSAGENAFEWECICYEEDNTYKGKVKIVFPDQQAFDTFASAMSESVEIAMQAGVAEADLVH